MIFVNVKDSELVKCSSLKKEADFIEIDVSLIDYVSKFFGNAKYRNVKISNELIETILMLNDEIAGIRKEAENQIKNTVESMDLESLVSNQIEENEKKVDEIYNRIETQGNSFILFSRSKKTEKILKYKVLGFDGDIFIVQSAESTAKERKPRTYKKAGSDFLNAEKVKLEIRYNELEEMEKQLNEKKREFELLQMNVA